MEKTGKKVKKILRGLNQKHETKEKTKPWGQQLPKAICQALVAWWHGFNRPWERDQKKKKKANLSYFIL